MKKVFTRSLLLFLFWVILSGQTDIFYLLSGIVCSVLAESLIQRLSAGHPYMAVFSFRAPLYFVWLAKEIFISAIKVSFMIWSPKLKMNPDLKFIGTKIKTKAGKILFAGSITLTPGTITIDLKNDTMLVHALDKADLEGLENGKMEGKIQAI